LKDALPYTAAAPAHVTQVHDPKVTKALVQVTPRNPVPIAVASRMIG
jgi:hypothetical protein